jgi:molecular chaperone GrpE
MHDALRLATRELAAAREAGAQSSPMAPPSQWRRLWPFRRRARAERLAVSETLRAARERLAAALTGLEMTARRVERALARHDLEPIEVHGRAFDPETTEVLEVVAAEGRPAGEVVEEVRRGYRWRGRVFRYAQVRVAK